MLNLLLICSKLAENRTGGVQTRVINYAKCAQRLNANLTVLSIDKYPNISEQKYYNTVLYKYPKNLFLKYPGFLNNIIRDKKINAIHILEGSLGKLQTATLMLSKFYNIKTGISLYGGEMWDISSSKNIIPKIKLWFIQNFSNKIAVNSKATAKFIPQKFQAKIGTIYPGANVDLLKYKIDPSHSDNFNILFVSRIFRRKGLDDILHAIKIVSKKHPNIHLNIIGPTNESMHYQELAIENKIEGKVTDSVTFYQKLADKIGIANKTNFIGEIKEFNELAQYYSQCDVFIMTPKITDPPSGYESFGCVYLEASLFKKPVIGTKHYGVQESVLNNKTGLLVEENDPKDIANAIIKLIENPELRRKLGEEGYQRTMKYFKDSDSTAQLLKIYQ